MRFDTLRKLTVRVQPCVRAVLFGASLFAASVTMPACSGNSEGEGKGFCIAPDPNECEGQCTDTATDAENCGVCGHMCSATQVCRNGACIP